MPILIIDNVNVLKYEATTTTINKLLMFAKLSSDEKFYKVIISGIIINIIFLALLI